MASAATKTTKKTQEESSCRFGFIRSFLRLQYCSILMVARFREAHFDILRVLNQSEKLLIAFRPCLLCSDLNARCLKYTFSVVRRQRNVQVENAARKLLAA